MSETNDHTIKSVWDVEVRSKSTALGSTRVLEFTVSFDNIGYDINAQYAGNSPTHLRVVVNGTSRVNSGIPSEPWRVSATLDFTGYTPGDTVTVETYIPGKGVFSRVDLTDRVKDAAEGSGLYNSGGSRSESTGWDPVDSYDPSDNQPEGSGSIGSEPSGGSSDAESGTGSESGTGGLTDSESGTDAGSETNTESGTDAGGETNSPTGTDAASGTGGLTGSEGETNTESGTDAESGTGGPADTDTQPDHLTGTDTSETGGLPQGSSSAEGDTDTGSSLRRPAAIGLGLGLVGAAVMRND